MLRKRSTGTGSRSRQALTMADSAASSPLQSPSGNYRNPTSSSSFFSSPGLFTNLTSKGFFETETIMSPTSILDSNKPFSVFKNPFWSETNSPRTPPSSSLEQPRRYWDKLDSKPVGLGLVDSLIDDDQNPNFSSKPDNRMVVFGSQLKIQIPLIAPSESMKPPEKKSGFGSASSNYSPRVTPGCLSASEIESSEEYTRVTSHGPNPRTTHIFDDCVIESSCFDVGIGLSSPATAMKENEFGYPSESFLSSCFYCKKNLGQGKDIFMYRGERAFCSRECRYQGILMEEEEEGMEKLEAEEFPIS
ncbi:FCS-Like Zinc finger 8-like isoform X2 [Neltuma alba]|nr:FCS-Like Zinc finger 8-like isoform X2 [Prosopis alba]